MTFKRSGFFLCVISALLFCTSEPVHAGPARSGAHQAPRSGAKPSRPSPTAANNAAHAAQHHAAARAAAQRVHNNNEANQKRFQHEAREREQKAKAHKANEKAAQSNSDDLSDN